MGKCRRKKLLKSYERNFRSCYCYCIDIGGCIYSCWIYSRHRRKIIPAVCYYHCGIGFNFCIRSTFANSGTLQYHVKTSKEADAKKNWLERFFISFNKGFERVTRGYGRSVGKWIKATPYVLVMMVCLFAGLYLLFKNKPSGFIPTEDEGRLFVTYEMPEGTSTTRNIAMMKELQARIVSIPAVKVAGGLAGLNFISFSNKSNTGTIFISLKPWDQRKSKELQVQGVIASIQKKVADIKEARILPISPPAIPGLGQTSGFSFVLQQTTSTDSIQQFEAVARKFIGALNQRPEIGSAYTFSPPKPPVTGLMLIRKSKKIRGLYCRSLYNHLNLIG